MSALVEALDLKAALVDVRENGAAYVPAALDAAFRKRLQRELEAGPFAPAPEQVGEVSQQVASFVARGVALDAFPLAREVLEELAAIVKRDGASIKGLAGWRPNLIMAQRFVPGTIGITPHLDGKRFAKLIAFVTAKGTAPFTLCRNRKGDPVSRWQLQSGSVVLLRAPGFAGIEDGRPFHMVQGPVRGERYSLALRMDTR